MSILIAKPGILTSVQDLGRTGYLSFGVNSNGPMDPISARLVNALLANDDAAAFLEMHFPAPEIIFERDAIIAIGGADFLPLINGHEIANWQSQEVRRADVLTFRRCVSGRRAYLAVRGGFDVEKWLGSSSTNLTAHAGGHQGRKLESGDRIRISDGSSFASLVSRIRIGPSLIPDLKMSPVRVLAGPELEQLTALSESKLFTETFTISKESDRMGFRLAGPPLVRLTDVDMLSSGTAVGTVQLLPNGQLIVLMADHQTTGGYPRVANVAYTDLGILGQRGRGDPVCFQFIDNREAERLRLEFERELAILKMGLKLRASLPL
jgi:antagonist of KipI